MSNSPLVNYTLISPHQNSPRNHVIDTITIHCVAGQGSVEGLGYLFQTKAASANYGIGYDGRVGMYVEEKDRSWCTSSYENDNRAITIECASDSVEPCAVYDNVYSKLLDLVTDICKRNGIKKLVWSTDKAKRMAHSNGCNMTVHRDYEPGKGCPGNYLYSRMGRIAAEVNKRLGAAPAPSPTPTPIKNIKAGDVVKIKSGATYTNGKKIPIMILAEEWIVKSVSESVAVIDKSLSGSWSINSAVNTKYLIVQKNAFKPYMVRVTADVLNIRKKPGTNYPITGKITDKGIYTIIAESKGNGADLWGKLKSGAGWIALDYTKEA